MELRTWCPVVLSALADDQIVRARDVLELLCRRLRSRGGDPAAVLQLLWAMGDELHRALDRLKVSPDRRREAERALARLTYLAAVVAGHAEMGNTWSSRGVPRAGAFADLLGGLLAAVDPEAGEEGFWNRICESVCLATGLERSALFLYREEVGVLEGIGAHAVDLGLIRQIREPLEAVPMAARALREERVTEATELLDRAIPAKYIPMFQLTTLVCAPMVVGRRWYGVIFADHAGRRFHLSGPKRAELRAVAKVAALAAQSAVLAQREARLRQLRSNLAVVREIHDRTLQRLFGVSGVLAALGGLHQDIDRCAEEISLALRELRAGLLRVLEGLPSGAARGDGEDMGGLEVIQQVVATSPLDVEVTWDAGTLAPGVLAVVEAVVREALTNAVKHTSARRAWVRARKDGQDLVVEVEDDGGGRVGHRGTGLGLRVLQGLVADAGGSVELVQGRCGWVVRCVLPQSV